MIELENVLFAKVNDIATAEAIPVKFPNRNGPQDATTWLEVVHIPNGEAKRGWNDLKANQGILNIGVNVDPNTGSTVAAPIVENIKAEFAQGTLLFGSGVKVEIYSPPQVGRLIETGQKAFFPVSIRYRSFEE